MSKRKRDFKLSDYPLAVRYVRWSFLRSILHNGWWLVTSLYLVIDAELSASQLITIGVIQGIASFIFEVPAGVVADTISRKYSIVISHLLMGIAMCLTGLLTDFTLLIMSQILWGIAWTFSSGADVAYITDELNQPTVISRILARTVRAQLKGAVFGIVIFGSFAWATTFSIAMVSAGILILILGVYFMVTFVEKNFVSTSEKRWNESYIIFKQGLSLIKSSRALLIIFLATFLVNGAADIYTRISPKRLVAVELPGVESEIAWLMFLSFISLLLGMLILRIVEHQVHDIKNSYLDYVFAALLGCFGFVLLALPSYQYICAGIVILSGIAFPMIRSLTSIIVNEYTTNKVRSTVHSFLAQAEYLGEIICGGLIGLIVNNGHLYIGLLFCAGLMYLACFLVSNFRKIKLHWDFTE